MIRPLALALLLPAASSRADTRLPIAVLQLESHSKRVSDAEVLFITTAVRGATAKVLDPSRYDVMTRETMDIRRPSANRILTAGPISPTIPSCAFPTQQVMSR